MKIAILTVASPELNSITQYTLPVTSDYCVKKGYDFISIRPDTSVRDASWYKIDALQKFLPHYDYIFVLDADAIIQNDVFNLEDIIADMHGAWLSVCDDQPNGGLINCGAF